MLHRFGKAETGENARRARRRAMRVDRVEPLVDFADAVRIVRVLGLRQQLGPLLRRRQHGLVRSALPPGASCATIADPRA